MTVSFWRSSCDGYPPFYWKGPSMSKTHPETLRMFSIGRHTLCFASKS